MPSLFPKGRRGKPPQKTPLSPNEGDVTANNPFFCLYLPCPAFKKPLPFCSPSEYLYLLDGMCPIHKLLNSQLDVQIYVPEFCFLTIVCSPQILRGGAATPQAATKRGTRLGQAEGAVLCTGAFIVVSEGRSPWAGEAGSGWASWTAFRALGHRDLPGCLVPPGGLGQVDSSPE